MMKKTLSLCVALLSVTALLAKPYTQQGIAYLYDYKTKTKNPVANVSLTVAYAKGPAISRADGTFTIEFLDFGVGKKLAFEKQPFSQGLIVLNKKEVDEWSTFEGRLTLIMCNKKDFDVCKQNYYNVGLQSVTQRYEQKIAALKRESADYQQRLQELEEERERIMDNLRGSADAMARIDQSEISRQMQEVYSLYEQGEVDKAMEMLSEVRLDEGLNQAIERKERSEREYQKAVQDSVIAVKNIESAIQLYYNSGEWNKVERYKWLLANKVGTPLDIFEYAYFCMNRPEYQDSVIPYYKRVMEVTEDSRRCILSHLYLYATAAYNLGCVYQSRKQTELANKFLEIGVEERKEYARQSPNLNDEGHVAWALVGKANEEMSNGLFKEAKQHLEEAGEIYDRIVALNPDEHLWALGRLHAYHGDWYRKQNMFEEAEKEYAIAMIMFKEYIDIWPVEFLTYIKYSFNSLLSWILPAIITQEKLQKLGGAKELLDDIYHYYQKTPLKDVKFKEETALEMRSISDYLIHLEMFKEAEEMCKQTLEIYQQLSNDNPKAYEPSLAMTLGNLAILYSNTQRFIEAEETYKQVMELFQRLANDNPKAYEPYLAMTLNNLAALYSDTQRFMEAEEMYKLALEIYQRLANDNPKAYEPYVAETLGNSAFIAIFLKKFSKAEQLAREGLEVDSTQHFIYTNLASSLLLQGRYSDAEPIYRHYKDELKDDFLDDFKQFKAAGVIPKEREVDVEKIKRMLERIR